MLNYRESTFRLEWHKISKVTTITSYFIDNYWISFPLIEWMHLVEKNEWPYLSLIGEAFGLFIQRTITIGFLLLLIMKHSPLTRVRSVVEILGVFYGRKWWREPRHLEVFPSSRGRPSRRIVEAFPGRRGGYLRTSVTHYFKKIGSNLILSNHVWFLFRLRIQYSFNFRWLRSHFHGISSRKCIHFESFSKWGDHHSKLLLELVNSQLGFEILLMDHSQRVT